MLGLAWIVFGVAAFLFWRKLDNRIYNNELQQAHTDTFMGAQRDSLDDTRRRVERVDNDLRAHVNQYEMETTMMEDLITTVHYGLVEHGGFVRFTTLSRQQRESMLVQERANMVLHNMQQRAPDNTDAPAEPSLPRSMEDAMEPNEQGEEERQTEDETMETVEVEVEPEREEGDLTKLLRNLRCVINRSLEENRFEDAAEVQTLVLAVLEATEQRNGLTAELATNVQNGFQRLYRKARNRGDETTARVYKSYVDDFRLLLGWNACRNNYGWFLSELAERRFAVGKGFRAILKPEAWFVESFFSLFQSLREFRAYSWNQSWSYRCQRRSAKMLQMHSFHGWHAQIERTTVTESRSVTSFHMSFHDKIVMYLRPF